MKDLGWDYEDIDFAEENKKTLKQKLWDKEVIFVEGGNTFYLLKHARESWFNDMIWWLIENGVIYIWSSAGTYLVTPWIISATKSNQGYDRCGVTDFTGLNIFPHLVRVHYHEEQYEQVQEASEKFSLPVRALSDGQALFIQNGMIQFVGEGKHRVYYGNDRW